MRLPAREEIIGRDRTDGCRGRGRTSALCFSLSHSPSVKDVAGDPFPSVSFFHTDINNTVITPPHPPEWDSNGRLDLGLFLFSPLWLRPAVSETHKIIKQSSGCFQAKIFRRKQEQPPSIHTALGSACISVAGVKLRNSLSEDPKQIKSVVQLKNK